MMEDLSLQDVCEELEKDELIALIKHLADHYQDIDMAVIDWIIDLGPAGGDAGGTIVAEGTPEEIAAINESHTGAFL
ncbi:hypothetical protein QUF88_07415 [Bacillus sp. DX1.1]|uniref:hypothetical protein n=1 Tax=unclassified Bacillus (in: firmicutes) TaxID=185979 RepID=UPI002570CC26|nr:MULTISPECIES: hypothetical protein [unclassified Bacillus (in: firmicutes)]MDM5153661.1 hypothetical protein [Bacillus sp. DX1.1]WJE82602.1 hypothetical protein QRE67_04920 [Bacillus sp. DX3.1]